MFWLGLAIVIIILAIVEQNAEGHTRKKNKRQEAALDDYRQKHDIAKTFLINRNIERKKQKAIYMESPQWREKKMKRQSQDFNQCIICGNHDNLNCHHITYKNLFKEPMADLRTLCSECHTSVHKEHGFPSQDLETYLDGYFWKI